MQKVEQFFHGNSFTFIGLEMFLVAITSTHFHALCLSNNTSLQDNNIQDEIQVNHWLHEEETETILSTLQGMKVLFYPVKKSKLSISLDQ